MVLYRKPETDTIESKRNKIMEIKRHGTARYMQLTIVPLLLIARTSLADPINCEASTATTVAGLVCSDTNLT